jgi:L-arabinose isomerase
MIRPKVGLLVPYVPFYEKIAPVREEKVAFAAQLAERLAADMDVVCNGLTATEREAEDAAAHMGAERVDAVIVAPAVAAFGALGWAALRKVSQPICLWNVQPDAGIPADYDIAALIRNSGGLGIQALANTLAREGRVFTVAFSTEKAPVPLKLQRFTQVAAVWHRLRTARFGRIGDTFAQMTDIAMDTAEWPGAPVVSVPRARILEAYEAQTEAAVSGHVAEIRASHPVAEITDDELARSARLSLALDAIVVEHAFDGGAFNCHGENCLQNDRIGVAACYGVSRQTSEGRPFSCTGDLPTAIAMKILQDLSDTAIYGELDLVDEAREVVLVANGGEGDFHAAAGGVRIAGNENFAGLCGRGASLRFKPFQGPATILSFTPLHAGGRYRLIAAEGALEAAPATRLGVFHAAFRFRGLGAREAFETWCEAGAVHHIAIASGEWAAHLEELARIADFEWRGIGGKA